MKRKAVLAVLCALPVIAFAVTGDDLRDLSSEAEQQQRQRAARLSADDLGGRFRLLEKTQKVEKGQTVTATETSPSMSATQRRTASTRDAEPIPQESHSVSMRTSASTPQTGSRAGEYVPPPREAVEANVHTDALTIDPTRFGISMGSWLQAELTRPTTSAEPGLLELTVTHDQPGRYRTLPKGTLLFAEKTVNGATQRLELRIVKGVTPDGNEFTLDAQLFDGQRHSGLAGVVLHRREDRLRYAAQDGVFGATRAWLRTVVSDDPIGAATRTAAEALVEEEQQSGERYRAPTVTLAVPPQAVQIRVNAAL